MNGENASPFTPWIGRKLWDNVDTERPRKRGVATPAGAYHRTQLGGILMVAHPQPPRIEPLR